MKFSFWALIITGFFFSHAVTAQDYNYLHYDLKDGLNGLTVYSETQDKDGFMWFGTDGGLSRFDGTHFRNFTTSDGLPDNEVLKLYVDSKSRLWMITFSHIICYYKDGKIHTPRNDSLLAKIKLSSEPVDIIEDKYGNIVLLENAVIHIIDGSGNITTYDDFKGNKFYAINAGMNDNKNVVISAILSKDHFKRMGPV
jgi:ligand-binding sensor domain-containing protein